MDWWTSSSASAAAAVSASAAAAAVANELGGPTGAGGGGAGGGPQHEPSNGFFDPWLNVSCDELDLSIILSQHHNHVPAHLTTTTFCDGNNSHPPSVGSPHQRTSSMSDGRNNSTDEFSSNNNNSSTCSSNTNNNKQEFTTASHYQSSLKTNGSLATTASSSTTTTCPSSPGRAQACGNNQVQSDNSNLCTAMHTQDLAAASNCSSANNFDLGDKLRFQMGGSSNEHCKSLTSSIASRQQNAQHNNFFDHILNTNHSTPSQQSTISKQTMQPTSTYIGRTLITNNNTNDNVKMHNHQHLLQQQQQQQISYLSCSSAASPITSSSVSSSIELSPQNSVEISSNGTPAHTCYPLGTSYRLNVLSPISPTSLTICGSQTIESSDQQHRANSLPLLQNIGSGLIDHHQSEYRRLSDGLTKTVDPMNHVHANQSRYINPYTDEQVGTLLRKSNLADELPPLFDSNRCDSLKGTDSDGCRCVAVADNGDSTCGNGNRQRLRNNLENLLQLASGTDGPPMSVGRDCNTDCKRLNVPSERQLDQSNNLQVPVMKQNKQLQAQAPSTSAVQVHNSDGKYGDSLKETASQNGKIARLTNNNSNVQHQAADKRAKTTGTSKGSRLRRCRHITDYVLAEEEKRLLIKEGYTDFPMVSSSTRPLSRAEERILRKIRRKIRNKKSAQCSRQRKKEYVEELERKYTMVVRENEELKQLLKRIQQNANQG